MANFHLSLHFFFFVLIISWRLSLSVGFWKLISPPFVHANFHFYFPQHSLSSSHSSFTSCPTPPPSPPPPPFPPPPSPPPPPLSVVLPLLRCAMEEEPCRCWPCRAPLSRGTDDRKSARWHRAGLRHVTSSLERRGGWRGAGGWGRRHEVVHQLLALRQRRRGCDPPQVDNICLHNNLSCYSSSRTTPWTFSAPGQFLKGASICCLNLTAQTRTCFYGEIQLQKQTNQKKKKINKHICKPKMIIFIYTLNK